MGWLIQMLGAALVLSVLLDIYLTVLYARSGIGLYARTLDQWLWRGFRAAGRRLGKYEDRFLSFCGPTLMVGMVLLWVLGLVCGFGLIVWPRLGSGVVGSGAPSASTVFAGASSVSIVVSLGA